MKKLFVLCAVFCIAVFHLSARTIQFEHRLMIQESTDLVNWVNVRIDHQIEVPEATGRVFYRQIYSRQPNIIFILADDMRYDQYGLSDGGHPFLETPALDRLASEGIDFQRAYCTTPLCGPVRSSMFTGRLPARHGIRNHQGSNLYAYEMPNGPFLLNEMQKAGYDTAFFGKWFNGVKFSGRVGVDAWRAEGYPHQPKNIVSNTPEYWEWFNDVSYFKMLYYNQQGGWQQINRYETDVLRDFTLDYIRERQSDPTKPYFVFMSSLAPHAPFIPNTLYAGIYRDQVIPAYPNLVFNAKWSEDYTIQCEMVRSIDEAVGRILEVVDDNTIIVFTSDNGYLQGEHNTAGKTVPWEESVRVPFFWWDPGHVAPRKSSQVIGLVDIYQTFVELAGAQPEPDPYGYSQSMVPYIYRGEPHRDELLVTYYNAGDVTKLDFAQIITQDFTYWEYRSGAKALYAYGDDRYQLKNLLNDAASAESLQAMKTRLDAALGREGASVTGSNPMPPAWDDKAWLLVK